MDSIPKRKIFKKKKTSTIMEGQNPHISKDDSASVYETGTNISQKWRKQPNSKILKEKIWTTRGKIHFTRLKKSKDSTSITNIYSNLPSARGTMTLQRFHHSVEESPSNTIGTVLPCLYLPLNSPETKAR